MTTTIIGIILAAVGSVLTQICSMDQQNRQ